MCISRTSTVGDRPPLVEKAVLGIRMRPGGQRLDGIFARAFGRLGIGRERRKSPRIFSFSEPVVGIHRAVENLRVLDRRIRRQRRQRDVAASEV